MVNDRAPGKNFEGHGRAERACLTKMKAEQVRSPQKKRRGAETSSPSRGLYRPSLNNFGTKTTCIVLYIPSSTIFPMDANSDTQRAVIYHKSR